MEDLLCVILHGMLNKLALWDLGGGGLWGFKDRKEPGLTEGMLTLLSTDSIIHTLYSVCMFSALLNMFTRRNDPGKLSYFVYVVLNIEIISSSFLFVQSVKPLGEQK